MHKLYNRKKVVLLLRVKKDGCIHSWKSGGFHQLDDKIQNKLGKYIRFFHLEYSAAILVTHTCIIKGLKTCDIRSVLITISCKEHLKKNFY